MSTANLERVRRIKNRLVRLTTRVETLREVLEKILDDDSDMHQMNLTARAMDLLERQARAWPAMSMLGLKFRALGSEPLLRVGRVIQRMCFCNCSRFVRERCIEAVPVPSSGSAEGAPHAVCLAQWLCLPWCG